MPTERGREDEIRREIAAEREQLTGALADLRASIAAKRRPAAVVGILLAVVVATRLLRSR